MTRLMRASRALLLILAGGLGAGLAGRAACSADRAPAGDEVDAHAHFFNRFWVDGRPEKHVDYRHAFYASSYGRWGFFDRSSSYDLHMEEFGFRRVGEKVKVTFPQSGRSDEFTYQVGCQPPEPFDLCVDLDKNPWGAGPKRFYGFTDRWEEERHLGPVRDRVLAEAKRRGLPTR